MRAALLLVVIASVAWPASGTPRAAPRCFGAASRDPRRPCVNPALRGMVVPRPADAPMLPDAPCRPVSRTGLLSVCAFGRLTPAGPATVALIGDSHAAHFRATVDVAARARRRVAASITRPSCPFSRATPDIDGPLRAQCIRWNHDVLRWLRRHRRIRTIFVSAYTQRPGLEDATRFAAKVRGISAAWRALPRSVRLIVVLRDVPKADLGTMPCVERALAQHLHAALRCAVPRSVALQPDPAVAAAGALRSRRVTVVDLTRYMCGPQRCYPVVGGALVHRDDQHLTAVFAATLGPYLVRALAHARGW